MVITSKQSDTNEECDLSWPLLISLLPITVSLQISLLG